MKKHDCFIESKVIDSRYRGKSRTVRRRRECMVCLKRFTTTEGVADTILTEQEQLEHKDLMLLTTSRFEKQILHFREKLEAL